jgi:hypothetical protein
VVTQAAGKVQELGRLSRKIGAVVETIDDIAEQTNLLALNAAIEAARAGEHGKGFAVVADEVRKLAERSSRETKQISELIAQVQGGTREAVEAMESGAAKVEQGSGKADLAGKALAEILVAVEDTVTQVNSIAAAAQEMASSSRSVVEAMEGVSAVVEENSASTKEMAVQAAQVTSAIQDIAAVAEEQSASSEGLRLGARVDRPGSGHELSSASVGGYRRAPSSSGRPFQRWTQRRPRTTEGSCRSDARPSLSTRSDQGARGTRKARFRPTHAAPVGPAQAIGGVHLSNWSTRKESHPGRPLTLVDQHYRYVSSANIDAEDEAFSPDVQTLDPGAGTLRRPQAFTMCEQHSTW